MQNRIRELRKENKMTMKQLGEIIGVAESTISQYETGKREPDNEMLLRLAEHFGVTVDFLLGASAPKKTVRPHEEGRTGYRTEAFRNAERPGRAG